MDFANLADNNGFEPDNMREYFKNDGDGSKYVKIIATDQSNILKNISTIPFYHTKDVALDYLFLDTDIMEIIPDFIGTYEEKYSSLVITNKQQHDDDFLYFHWKLYVKNQKDVGKFVHFQWFFFSCQPFVSNSKQNLTQNKDEKKDISLHITIPNKQETNY